MTNKVSMLHPPTVTPHVTVRDAPGHAFTKKRVLVTIDLSTGDEVARYVDDGRQMPEQGDWLRIYQGYALQVASGPDTLTPIESKALWLVIARASFGNMAYINAAAAARDWSVSRESVSRALTALVKRRMVERAKGGAYRLNPNFAWKGQSELRRPFQAKWSNDNETNMGQEERCAG